MKVDRKIIQIDEELCNGCGQCIPSCAEGALKIVDGKAKIIADKLCDGLGACLGNCPEGALKVIERTADEFDEEAVSTHLAKTDNKPAHIECGCPSSHIQTFNQNNILPHPSIKPSMDDVGNSNLTHWPIKIRLVPPAAPFLKNADLLVLADCTAAAYPHLHQDLIDGKTVLMGCPKFDDIEGYIEKFAAIFDTAQLKSVTVAIMEVPCCSGMPVIVKKGMEKSTASLNIEVIVISGKGGVLERSKMS